MSSTTRVPPSRRGRAMQAPGTATRGGVGTEGPPRGDREREELGPWSIAGTCGIRAMRARAASSPPMASPPPWPLGDEVTYLVAEARCAGPSCALRCAPLATDAATAVRDRRRGDDGVVPLSSTPLVLAAPSIACGCSVRRLAGLRPAPAGARSGTGARRLPGVAQAPTLGDPAVERVVLVDDAVCGDSDERRAATSAAPTCERPLGYTETCCGLLAAAHSKR